MKLLSFLLSDVQMCIDLQYVEKVLSLPLLEAVPNSPVYLLGIMNLEGESIPVIDLALRLGMEREELYSITIPIILCRNDTQRVGLIVDEIMGLADVDEELLQLHDNFKQAGSHFLATVTQKQQVSLLLNAKYALSIHLTQQDG